MRLRHVQRSMFPMVIARPHEAKMRRPDTRRVFTAVMQVDAAGERSDQQFVDPTMSAFTTSETVALAVEAAGPFPTTRGGRSPGDTNRVVRRHL